MHGQHCDDGLCQVQGHDISRPDTMSYHAPKQGTWQYIDISDPDTPQPQQPQQSQHPRGLSRCAPTPPPRSGYAYVPPFAVQPQPQPTPEASNEEDDASDDGFTEAALFPLPPTSHQHGYHTFPTPTTTPTTTTTIPTPTTTTTTTPNHHHDPCYFETLDFSDYQHRRPSLSLLPPPAARSAADEWDEKDSAEQDDAYRPRVRGWAYREGGGRDDGLVTRGLLSSSSLLSSSLSSSFGKVDGRVGVERIGAGMGEEEEEKRAWRTAGRRVVVVVVAWMVVVGVLVALQWVVEGGGGGRFVDDAAARGGVDGVRGEWGPCTEARPRFCRLVVGGGEQ